MACTGPNNEKWDGETCVGTPAQTSCDGVNMTTCFYADLQFEEGGESLANGDRKYFGGQFIEPKSKSSDGESGMFRIDLVGPLEILGINPGEIIYQLNGKNPTAKAILSFTKEKPARSAGVYRSTDEKEISLYLYR